MSKYFSYTLIVFLSLFLFVLAINVIGHYLLNSIKNEASHNVINRNLFNPIGLIMLLGSLIRDIIISTLLVYILFKLINKNITFIALLYADGVV